MSRLLGQPWMRKHSALLARTNCSGDPFSRPQPRSIHQLNDAALHAGQNCDAANLGPPPLSESSNVARARTVVDRILPRERFGSSIFNTPLLLLLRLFYQARPFRPNILPTSSKSSWSDTFEISCIIAGFKPAKQPSTRSDASPADTDTTFKASTESWRQYLLNSEYPIAPTSRLWSLTWIKSLSAPLSHEYIQFVLEDVDANRRHRLIVERDTYGDYVLICSRTASDSSKMDVPSGPKADEQHDLPLPLLSLSWAHLAAQDRPTALELADVVAKVTQRSPRYNLSRTHCWWFCEAVFDGMVTHNQSPGSAVLKHWRWAAYRYSYIVVGKNVLRRVALIRHAQDFSAEMDRGQTMVW